MADGLSVLDEKMLSVAGSTRATAYGSANKIITIGDKTHFAWLDTKSATMIQTYDRSTKTWSAPVHIGSGLDNHGGPALCADSQGYLHVAFGPHHGPLQYYKSERPNDASAWVQMPEFGDHATYPSLICGPDDTLYCAYRGKTAPFRLVFQRKPAGGEWSEPLEVVDAGVPDGYTQFGNCLCFGANGTIHLAFHVYDMHPARGKAAGHLQSGDGGRTWTLVDGTPVDLPFKPDQSGWIVQSPAHDMRCWTVDCDPDGNPFVCVTRYRPAPPTVEIWTYRDGSWQATDLYATLNANTQAGEVTDATLSINDEGEIFVVVSASPQGGWSHPLNEIFLLHSVDGGATYQVSRISQPDPTVPNWLPSVERHTGHNVVQAPHIMYTHGVMGEGCTPSDVTQVRATTIGTSE